MNEPTIMTPGQIEAFVNAVCDRLNTDLFLRHKCCWYENKIFDVRDKNHTLFKQTFVSQVSLPWSVFPWGVFIDKKLAKQINKNINYSIYVAEGWNQTFNMSFDKNNNNEACLWIPENSMCALLCACNNVEITAKERHKVVIRTQQYCRDFIKTRFMKVW